MDGFGRVPQSTRQKENGKEKYRFQSAKKGRKLKEQMAMATKKHKKWKESHVPCNVLWTEHDESCQKRNVVYKLCLTPVFPCHRNTTSTEMAPPPPISCTYLLYPFRLGDSIYFERVVQQRFNEFFIQHYLKNPISGWFCCICMSLGTSMDSRAGI